MKKTQHLRGKRATPKKLAENAQTTIACSQVTTRKSTISENHTVQHTSEIASHSLSYVAKDYKASEIRKLYAARDHKASENPDVYEARSEEASDEKSCMKPTKHKASETERALKALYKRLEAGRKKKDEARNEEAAESGQQQQCILSGEVHLRHRSRKASVPKDIIALLFPQRYCTPSIVSVQDKACGVRACRRARSSTLNEKASIIPAISTIAIL